MRSPNPPLGTICRFSDSHRLDLLKLTALSADSTLEMHLPSGTWRSPLHIYLGGMPHGRNCPGILAGLPPVRSDEIQPNRKRKPRGPRQHCNEPQKQIRNRSLCRDAARAFGTQQLDGPLRRRVDHAEQNHKRLARYAEASTDVHFPRGIPKANQFKVNVTLGG